MTIIIDYPAWKKAAWRLLRVMLATGLAEVGLIAMNLLAVDSVEDGALLIVAAFVSGAASAGSKYLRDISPTAKDEPLSVHKLPL